MDNIYLIMLIALAILAIADLVVGVSNDAVNFLNSAIGSKAVSFKTIMIVASVGIAFGALSSSGMMEVNNPLTSAGSGFLGSAFPDTRTMCRIISPMSPPSLLGLRRRRARIADFFLCSSPDMWRMVRP